MPTTTMLDQATAMIENAWGQPLDALELLAVRRPSEDPLLRCAMHTRTALAITDNAATVHQDRLHALSRHGYVPDFYELDRITETAVSLRVAHAESRAYLQAIRRVVEAREAAAPEVEAPTVRLAQAAVARSGQTRHAPGAMPNRPLRRPSSGRQRPQRGPDVERLALILVAVALFCAEAHRAGQLLHRQLRAPAFGDPALHRLLVRPLVALCADSPLAVGNHRDVAQVHGRPAARILRSNPAPSQCLVVSAITVPLLSPAARHRNPCRTTAVACPFPGLPSPADDPSSPTADVLAGKRLRTSAWRMPTYGCRENSRSTKGSI